MQVSTISQDVSEDTFSSTPASEVLHRRYGHGLCDPMGSIAYQVPLSMGFSRQEYWSGLPFPSSMHESET